MYTEIKELVNFIAKHLLGRLPRRSVSLFCEQFANHLVQFYTPRWQHDNPTQGEKERVVRIKVGDNQTDMKLTSAAQLVGIDIEEMLSYLPDNILLYANPGTVFYRFGETAPPVPIWVGDKNADKHYNPQPEYVVKFNQQKASGTTATVPVPISNMGAAGRMSYPMTRLARKSDGHAHHASATAGSDPADQPDSLYVRLQIVEYKPLPTEELPVHIERGDYKVFQFQPVNHVIYRAEQFALTRFGSHRQRPDHDVMKRIQQSAVLKHLGMTDPESEQRGANPPLAQDIRSDAATSHTQTVMTTATSKA